jgi:hypothetical protein
MFERVETPKKEQRKNDNENFWQNFKLSKSKRNGWEWLAAKDHAKSHRLYREQFAFAGGSGMRFGSEGAKLTSLAMLAECWLRKWPYTFIASAPPSLWPSHLRRSKLSTPFSRQRVALTRSPQVESSAFFPFPVGWL